MKVKDWITKAKIAAAVGRTIMTGRHSGIFDKVDRGIEIADRSGEIAALVRELIDSPRKPTGNANNPQGNPQKPAK